MEKRNLTIIMTVVISLTIGLIVLGLIFNKSELEKINGFTGEFAISKDGTIAYVNYNEGEPELYLSNNPHRPIITLDATKEITDLVFTPADSALFYIVNNKEIDSENLGSTVFEVNINSLKINEVFTEEKLITEITFDPKDETVLFYLRAGTFENYSPIARAYPHDFDIFSYSLDKKETTRHTSFEKYDMNSLQISDKEHIAYIQMTDDFDAETADELFEMKQKIFEISLEKPENVKVISESGVEQDIYDMFYIYEYETIIFQAVGSTSEKGIFEYELFALDLNENKKTQLTFLKEYTEHPVYSAHDDKIYFIVDKKFAKSYPEYYLYRMNRDGSEMEEVI